MTGMAGTNITPCVRFREVSVKREFTVHTGMHVLVNIQHLVHEQYSGIYFVVFRFYDFFVHL